MSAHPLRIGISTRLMHQVPAELGLRGKTLQQLEQTFAHWIPRPNGRPEDLMNPG